MSPYASSCSLGFVEVKVIFRIWRELSSGKWVFLPRRRDEQVTAKESSTVLRGYSSSSRSVLSLVWVFQRKAYLSILSGQSSLAGPGNSAEPQGSLKSRLSERKEMMKYTRM